MQQQLSISYPESLADLLKMNSNEFVSEMKIMSIIKLYELGKISSGNAAKHLGISRIDFLELLGKYNVSFFPHGMEDELEKDLANA